MNFDFEGYWMDVIQPLWDQLPDQIKHIVRAMGAAPGVRQDSQCHIDWSSVPESLREKIQALDDATLARTAVIAHDYGHCRPGAIIPDGFEDDPRAKEETGARPRFRCPGEDIGGGGWQFALCADRVLSDRLEIPRDAAPRTRTGLYIHEGRFRLYHQGNGHWIWEDVALATAETLRQIREWLVRYEHGDDRIWLFGADDVRLIARQLLDHVHPAGTAERQLLDKSPWLVSKEEEEWRRAARRAPLSGGPVPPRPEPKSDEAKVERLREMVIDHPITVVRIAQVNHRLKKGVNPVKHTGPAGSDSTRHPFMITQRHLAGDSPTLNPRSAPCGICGCQYDEHTHDTVAVVRPDPGTSVDQIQAALMVIKDQAETWGIDGFVFVRPEGEEEAA
ncbi:MAG: hypothetical protein ACOC93_02195 [Planctomycetota bacterium]